MDGAVSNQKSIFWRDNYLMPIVRVQILRSNERKCTELIERPGFDEVYNDDICILPFTMKSYQKDEFDGAPFTEHSWEVYNIELASLPDTGNYRDLDISPSFGEYEWSETLKSEIFDRGWLSDQTISIMITVNIVNKELR